MNIYENLSTIVSKRDLPECHKKQGSSCFCYCEGNNIKSLKIIKDPVCKKCGFQKGMYLV